jgi:hypothetical protein
MSSTGSVDAALAGAARAIQTSQAYQAGKAEQFLNTLGGHSHHSFLWPSVSFARCSPLVLGDHALAVSGSEAVTMIQDIAGSTAFGLVKERVSHFAENSELLVRALDEIGNVHPFIKRMSLLPSSSSLLTSADVYCLVAVTVFRAAIALEVDRRGNDQKLTMLHVAMCDMMEVMTLSVKSSLPIAVRSHTL